MNVKPLTDIAYKQQTVSFSRLSYKKREKKVHIVFVLVQSQLLIACMYLCTVSYQSKTVFKLQCL